MQCRRQTKYVICIVDVYVEVEVGVGVEIGVVVVKLRFSTPSILLRVVGVGRKMEIKAHLSQS